MKITIESTDTLTQIDGVDVRLWEGTAQDGTPCKVFVHRIARLDDGAGDHFDDALLHLSPPPGNAPLEEALDPSGRLGAWIYNAFGRLEVDQMQMTLMALGLLLLDKSGGEMVKLAMCDKPPKILSAVIAARGDSATHLMDAADARREETTAATEGTEDTEDTEGSAAICRKKGWRVGTVLEGDEGEGSSRIVLTAIGMSGVLAVDEDGNEQSWTLLHRDWRAVGHKHFPVLEARR